eukprot:Hpha_TRINITY_DN16651_c0_g10::TRINITY_DN16651_c0_g10_i1::g.179298::m.179298
MPDSLPDLQRHPQPPGSRPPRARPLLNDDSRSRLPSPGKGKPGKNNLQALLAEQRESMERAEQAYTHYARQSGGGTGDRRPQTHHERRTNRSDVPILPDFPVRMPERPPEGSREGSSREGRLRLDAGFLNQTADGIVSRLGSVVQAAEARIRFLVESSTEQLSTRLSAVSGHGIPLGQPGEDHLLHKPPPLTPAHPSKYRRHSNSPEGRVMTGTMTGTTSQTRDASTQTGAPRITVPGLGDSPLGDSSNQSFHQDSFLHPRDNSARQGLDSHNERLLKSLTFLEKGQAESRRRSSVTSMQDDQLLRRMVGSMQKCNPSIAVLSASLTSLMDCASDVASVVSALEAAIVGGASINPSRPVVTVWSPAGDGVTRGRNGRVETRGLAAWARRESLRAPVLLSGAATVAAHPGYNPQVDGSPSDLLLIPLAWQGTPACFLTISALGMDPQFVVHCLLVARYAEPIFGQFRASNTGFPVLVALLDFVATLGEDTFNRDKLVDTICKHGRTLLNADSCRLWLVDANQKVLRNATALLPLDYSSRIGCVALTGVAQSMDDKRGSMVWMPLKWSERVHAVAEFTRKKMGLGEGDEALVNVFATFAATALGNCEVHAQARLASEQSASMLQLSRQLGAITLDAEAVKLQVIEDARKLVHADRGALFIVDGNELVGSFDGREHRMPLDKGIVGAVATSGMNISIPDAYSDPRFFKDIDLHTGYRTKNILAVPVKFNDSVVAVAQLINKLEARGGETICVNFTDADQRLLETFGAIAGIAIRTAETHRRERLEKEKVRTMLSAVASLLQVDIRSDLNSFCLSVVADLTKLVGCERGTLFAVDKERHLLRPHTAGGGVMA